MGNESKSRKTSPKKGPLTEQEEIPITNRCFGALIRLLGLNQAQAGAVLGIEAGTVSGYVSGKTELFPDNYERKCAAFGEAAAAVGQRLLDSAARLDATEALRQASPDSAGVIAEIGREAERLAAALSEEIRERTAEEAQEQAAARWKEIKKLEVHEWRLIAVAPEVQCWAFVKLVGEESARAASLDAGRALELARFAVWVAERVPGAEGWVSRVFAWVFLANALRVGSKLAEAEEALACSVRLQADPPEGRPELPEPWRLLDLEASLRIDLLQLPEALRLLDQAAEMAPQTGPVRAHLLCIRSNALERMEDPEGSIAALREALLGIDKEAEPHLLCTVQFNLMDSLCTVGRAAEAEEMLPALRRMQAQLGDGLNQIRLRWLEGNIDAGLGRLDRAIEALCWVRAAFAEEDVRYDEAQAGMELAWLYLQKGRTAEVKGLVRRMAPVFRAKGVHVEAQKALALFRRAVEMETATSELAGRVARYLRRAQHNPELIFEEAA